MIIMNSRLMKTGRKKIEIVKEILDYLEDKDDVFITSLKDLGLNNKNALEYIELINYFSNLFQNKDLIQIKEIGRNKILKKIK